MTKPKKCPFCGNTDRLKAEGPNEFKKYWVSCPCCACEGPWGKSKTSAVRWWNMRGPKPKPIPNTLEIKTYFHCGECLKSLPVGKSPREWGQLEVGFTVPGIQVWCKRHNLNVMHIDFHGEQHPANLTAKRKEFGNGSGQ